MPRSTATPHPLPEPLIELVVQRFRVLGEPMRIKLLDLLSEGDATVGLLQEALGSQQNVSNHPGILHAAGMVSRNKQGNGTRYAISGPSVIDLFDQVCGGSRRQLRELEAILQPPERASAVTVGGAGLSRAHRAAVHRASSGQPRAGRRGRPATQPLRNSLPTAAIISSVRSSCWSGSAPITHVWA